jgi:rRNA-processing protein FCF1
MMDCLLAKCESGCFPTSRTIGEYRLANRPELMVFSGIPTITDCVLAELEKLGPKYRLALRSVTMFYRSDQDRTGLGDSVANLVE